MTLVRMARDLEFFPTSFGAKVVAVRLDVMRLVVIAMRMLESAAVVVVFLAGTQAAPLIPLLALLAPTSVLVVTRAPLGIGVTAPALPLAAVVMVPRMAQFLLPLEITALCPAEEKAQSLVTASEFSVTEPAPPAVVPPPLVTALAPLPAGGLAEKVMLIWGVLAWCWGTPRQCACECGRPRG